MFNIVKHLGNANKSYFESLFHPSQKGCHQEKTVVTNGAADTGKETLMHSLLIGMQTGTVTMETHMKPCSGS